MTATDAVGNVSSAVTQTLVVDTTAPTVSSFTTATDFADYLVKDKNLNFREAYVISSKLVNYAEKKKKKL